MKRIGYWYSKLEPQYPMPIENSSTREQFEKQLEIFINFSHTSREVFYRGFSTCRICGKNVGSSEYEKVINKETVVMPSGLLHYLEEHNVLVPGLLEIPYEKFILN